MRIIINKNAIENHSQSRKIMRIILNYPHPKKMPRAFVYIYHHCHIFTKNTRGSLNYKIKKPPPLFYFTKEGGYSNKKILGSS